MTDCFVSLPGLTGQSILEDPPAKPEDDRRDYRVKPDNDKQNKT